MIDTILDNDIYFALFKRDAVGRISGACSALTKSKCHSHLDGIFNEVIFRENRKKLNLFQIESNMASSSKKMIFIIDNCKTFEYKFEQ